MEKEDMDKDKLAYSEFGVRAVAEFGASYNFDKAIDIINKGLKKYPYAISLVDTKFSYLTFGFNYLFTQRIQLIKKDVEFLNKQFLNVKKMFNDIKIEYKRITKKFPELKAGSEDKISMIDTKYIPALDTVLKQIKAIGFKGVKEKGVNKKKASKKTTKEKISKK